MLESKDKDIIEESLKAQIAIMETQYYDALKRSADANIEAETLLLKINSTKSTLQKFSPEYIKDYGRYDTYWAWWQKGEFVIIYFNQVLTVPEIFSGIQDMEISIRHSNNKRSMQASLSGSLAEKIDNVRLKRYKYNQRDYVYGLPNMFDSDGTPLREFCKEWLLVAIESQKKSMQIPSEATKGYNDKDDDLPF